MLLTGNSIFNGSRGQLEAELSGAGWEPVVEADGGTAIGFWVDRVPLLVAAEQPGALVIELGTNDCGEDQGCAPIGAEIDQIMYGIPSDTPVLWLNTQEDVPELFAANRDFVNGQLEAADARWPNFYLIDMNGFFSGHPEWHAPDGLHPNDTGKQELARFVADELDRFRAT